MVNDGSNSSENKRGYKKPSNVVILRKDSNGIVNAFPVSNTVTLGSRRYCIQKSPLSIQFSTKYKNQINGDNVLPDSPRNPEQKHCKQSQNEDKPSSAVLLPIVFSLKSLVKLLCIFITLGGGVLIIKHKKLISSLK